MWISLTRWVWCRTMSVLYSQQRWWGHLASSGWTVFIGCMRKGRLGQGLSPREIWMLNFDVVFPSIMRQSLRERWWVVRPLESVCFLEGMMEMVCLKGSVLGGENCVCTLTLDGGICPYCGLPGVYHDECWHQLSGVCHLLTPGWHLVSIWNWHMTKGTLAGWDVCGTDIQG